MTDVPRETSEEWKPVPDDRRCRARLLDGTLVEYSDLKVGDVFQAVTPAGLAFHPLDWDVGAEPELALVTAPPIVNPYLDEGWAVEIVCGPIDQLRSKLS